MSFMHTLAGRLKHFYESHYKKLLILPFALLVLAMIQIGMQYAVTGDFMNKAVSLKGGITITITDEAADVASIDTEALKRSIAAEFPSKDIDIRKQSNVEQTTGIIIDASIEDEKEIAQFKASLLKNIPGVTNEQIEENIAAIGSSLGQSFFSQTFRAMLIAFALMAIVVFAYFRMPVPSIAVILAAFSDITITLAIINLMGYKIGTAGIAAFLMLIGYSVDTDILLSTRVLKRKEGTVTDRIFGAMKTGMMMSATTMAAIIVALIFTQSDILRQIMTIILIGLLVDIINTWIQNAGILKWYMERKHGQA